MAYPLKQSTAGQEVPLGYFLDSTDGDTEETALTIANTDIKLHKNGATTLANKNSGGGTHISNGVYYAVLDATDTNTLGGLVIFVHVSGALAVRLECEVYPANVYDSLFAGTDNLQVDAIEISSDATAADNLEATYDGTGYADDDAPATQSQINNLPIGSAAVSVTAESFTKAGAEPETNTYTSTQQLDGTYHIVEDDTTSTDVYYQFDIGGNGIPVSFDWAGYAQGSGHTYSIYAYNYGGAAYEQVGTISGAAGTTLQTKIFKCTTNHVGTGANLGKVRFRILSSDGTAFATDRVLCNYAVVQSSLGFVGGAVWIDTTNGEAGTTSNIGTVGRPVDNIADAKTIADANTLKRFYFLPGSSVTLAAAHDGYEFTGFDYTVALGGQSVSGTLFENATITGNDDGSNTLATVYRNCLMASSTLGLHRLEDCRLSGTITLAEIGTFDWLDCRARATTPSVDVGSLLGNTTLYIRNYGGAIELQQLGQTGTDVVDLEGNGAVTLNANCAGGTLNIRGNFTVTDNAGGAVTVADDARYDTTQINTEMLDVLTVDTQSELSSVPGFPTTVVDMIKWMFTRSKHKTTTTAAVDTVYKDDGSTSLATSSLTEDGTTLTRGEYS